MRIVSFTRAAATVAAALMLSAGVPGQALAGFFDFFKSSPSEASSGKQLVVFTPQAQPGTIVVSFADRKLYLVLPNQRAISYPIGAPMGEARWEGVTFISEKRVNPMWTPTPDMRRENPTLPAYVPGGHPLNPLGPRAMYLGKTTYRIHGTDAPWTVGQEVSHGCIRMYNADVIDLYDRVGVGTRVVVTWQTYG
jgi:lipoprotein-anchoring transpeptidase ErfK/SrfK